MILPEHNGCGHVRLQLRADTERFYSVNKPASGVGNCDGAVPANNCISSAVVARRIIRRFFE